MKKLTVFLCLLTIVMCAAACKNTQGGKPDETGQEQTTNAEKLTGAENEEQEAMKEALKLKHTLRFREDGSFRVLVFSDVHAFETLAEDTVSAIEAVVKKEDPDLVIFNGDLNWAPTDKQVVINNVTAMTKYLEEHEIPWSHTFGNHDSTPNEDNTNISRAQQEEIFESFPYCVSKAGEADIAGVGNYVLPILRSDSDKIAFNVWALDSGDYLDLVMPGMQHEAVDKINKYTNGGDTYTFISFSQISWYYRTSEAMQKYNGEKIPGIMAFHIPLCEYNTIVNNKKQTGMIGSAGEKVCCSELNSGMFTAAMERGDIKMFVAGHDHVNDFVGEYCGIKLAYDANIGFQIYHDINKMGARVIEINQDDAWNFTTRMSYLKDIPDWNEGQHKDAGKSENIGKAPFEGDVLDAENTDKLNKSTVNLMLSHNPDELDGQYIATKLNAGGNANIVVSIANGKGFDSSAAYSVVKKSDKSNAEISFYLSESKKLDNAKYLRVWVDFTGIDFRKAAFGVITDKGENYNTDWNDGSNNDLFFYYLADGTDTWKTYKHGLDDGCFGDAQLSSVKDFKGWLAFPVADFRGWEGADGEYKENVGKAPGSEDMIAGIYMYYDLLEDGMLGKEFYLDQFGLVADYTKF